MSDTLNPQPTDQPDNTGGGKRSVTSPDSSSEPQTETDQPDNTGGGNSIKTE